MRPTIKLSLLFFVHVCLAVLAMPQARAETIPATPSVQTRASSSFVYAYSSISCGGSQVLAQSQFIYDSVASAGAAIPHAAINSHVQNSWGPQYCGDTRATGVRGAANEANLTMVVQRYWQGVLSSEGPVNLVFQRTTGCPSPWVVSGQNCTITTYSCPVTGGWTLEGSNCTRPDNACSTGVGTTRTVNVTNGWKRTSAQSIEDMVVNTMPTGADLAADRCVDGCMYTFQSLGDAWVSQEPHENGLHRVSQDFVMVKTSTTCTVGSNDLTNPNAPAPPCPGTRGQVEGKPVCFGTSSSPLPSNPPTPGTPPAGAGNPAAGAAPTSGPGSGTTGAGRTPLVGNGGNNGGGSNAAIPGGGSTGNGQTGSSGTGANGTPDRPADPCGLPGRPPCKIDESGTPNGDGAYGDATNALNSNKDVAVQGINDAAAASGKATAWTFTFAFPTGCTAIAMPGYDSLAGGIDICAWQGMIHDLMSMIWLAVTVWCCIGMVGRAVGGGS